MQKIQSGLEPLVGVLIPTYGEPVDMVMRTVQSVINQDWPHSKLVVAVGDDGDNPQLKEAILAYAQTNNADIIYHVPPRHGEPHRKGDAKAGNLNAILHKVLEKYPDINFIETRDADDLVGDKEFLRYSVWQLVHDENVSYVQTIKEAITSKGDPFSNMESVFYRRVMLCRYSVNAVFPCGSGLVWRISHLQKIGHFPHWNLVEDLQSGYEMLAEGGKGVYLPIVGALGQIAPEDIPNFYKQRGTWAIDTLRLFFWKNPFFYKNLTIWQKLHFFELEYSYLMSFVIPMYITLIAASLYFHIYPLTASPTAYLMHTATYVITLEVFNFLRLRGISYKDLWRTREMWLGLSPVFIMATYKALRHGPRKKPVYRVTRKSHIYSWYWKLTLFQYAIVSILIIGVVYSIKTSNDFGILEYGSIFWALFFIFGFSRMIRNSWFGVFEKEKKNQIHYRYSAIQLSNSIANA